MTVNSTGDSVDAVPGDRQCADAAGLCTLRAAVDEANFSSTRDAIIFDLLRPASIELTLGELTVMRSVDIIGPGARRLTIRRSAVPGTPDFRVFHIPAAAVFVNFRGMTIANGSDTLGGGLFVESGAVVGVFDAALTGNQAGAGGAISSLAGRITIARCLINSNAAKGQAGAIFNNDGYVAISSSTLTDNSAPVGGAIINNGELVLLHDTFSGNSAIEAASSILNSATGTVQVLNTIIGRDTSASPTSIEGAFQSAGNNLVTNSTASTGFTNGVNGDQVSENNAIDPLLGPLADNGGQTDTRALLPGSPALNNANVCARSGQCEGFPGVPGRLRDQRRRRRPFSGGIDIGAFETDGINLVGFGSFTFGRPFSGPLARFAGSVASVIDPVTLERRYGLVRVNGDVTFKDLATTDVYVLELRSKRSGAITPLILGFDF